MKKIIALALIALSFGCATQNKVIVSDSSKQLEAQFKMEPTAIPAVIQQVATQVFGTWTVKKHDTLWAISKTVYGDPFLWPSIYKENKLIIKSPHWIYPKQKFVYKLKGN